jgi:outer membrane protein assembly factor BamB
MIRFRVGQSWKREPAGPLGPQDAFAFEIDGVNLIPGATDEPLVRVVANLVDAVSAVVVDGERAGQLSLEDVSLEVCFWRRPGLEVEVTVLSLAQPPGRAQPTVVVELPALVEATVRCARDLVRQLGDPPPTLQKELSALEERLKALTRTVVADWPVRDAEPWLAEGETGGLGYVLRDVEGRATSYTRRSRAGLPSLLVEGAITSGATRVDGLPFLTLLGLARSASESKASLGGLPVEASLVFQAGLDLCLALRTRSPALTTNPWLEAMQVRCTEGLRGLRSPLPDTSKPALSAPRSPSGQPISAAGEVRRVALAPQWTRPVALGEDGGRLSVGRSVVVVASPHAAHAFTSKGRTAFRRLSPRGVATSTALTVCATGDRVLLFERGAATAAWLRDHDGSSIGPGLELVDGVLVTSVSRSGVVGFEPATGRERWRFEPPRAQKSHLTFAGSRVLVATDSGALFGLDAASGQVRFTVRSSMPFAGPAVRTGRRAVAVLKRGELTAVYVCEALASGSRRPAGTIAWTRELALAGPSTPVVSKGRIFLTGHRDGKALVVAISLGGRVLWERTTPLDPHTQLAVAFEGGLVVTDARGHAVRLLPDGETAWVLGSSGDQLLSPIAPVIRRHVLVVPGPLLRLVDPRGGRVLHQMETGARVVDVAVDQKLTVYVLKEPGILEAWRPATVLAVVG